MKYGRDWDSDINGMQHGRRFAHRPSPLLTFPLCLVPRVFCSRLIPAAPLHTHTKAGAINLSKSAAGIETPKDRAYAVFGENADVPASSASSSVPAPLLSSSSFYTPSFYPLDLSLWSSLVSCSFMLLTPFNLNLSHISSTLALKPPLFRLWSHFNG